MRADLQALLAEIYEFGTAFDRNRADRSERMRNVTPKTGALLALLVEATKARRVLEVGTSNGYSTLWLADAAQRLGGTVTTLEFLPGKAEMALENFRKAGLESLITLHLGDAGEYLRTCEAVYDFIFLDSDRAEYPIWWPQIQRVLAPGGLIAVDNTLSHAAEVQPFLDAVAVTPGFESYPLPIEQGVQLILKRLN
jgi:predicted O-methyltransferase YrrM